MRLLNNLKVVVCALSFILVLPNTALAWGKFGHLTVCDLAYRNMTDRTHEELKKLFQVETGGISVAGRGGVEARHYTSFNVGCLEEDELPRKHQDDHYLNVDRSTAAIDGNSCPGTASCIFDGIQRDLETLRDSSKSNEDRVFALMAVGHWIGDIHQPLHVSFADDRGGNWINVGLKGGCGTSKYRATNLHAVWDNCLLEAGLFERVRQRADFKKSWSKNTITYRAVDTLQINTTLSEEQAIVGTDPSIWANESYQITIDPKVGYCVMEGGVCQYSENVIKLPSKAQARTMNLDQAYLAEFERISEDRVRRAGFRLAHLVNLALDPEYTEPVMNSTQRP